MEYIIDKLSHKFLFFCIDFFFASVFALIVSPLGMKYLDMSFTNYYLLSIFILAMGGAFFDRGFVYMYKEFGEDYDSLGEMHWMVIFVVNMLFAFIVGFVIWKVNGDIFLSFFVPTFLIMGNWIWFHILCGYMSAKKDSEKEPKIILRIQKKSE